MVEFADALSRTPVDLSDDLRRRLDERFSRRQLVELANAIAWEHARARFNRALDISSDEFSTR